jgi:uncharacterized protein (UPF0333 family)
MKNFTKYCLLLPLVILIIILVAYCGNITETHSNQADLINQTLNQTTANVIYESPNAKVQKYIPFILTGLAALVIAGLVILKKR